MNIMFIETLSLLYIWSNKVIYALTPYITFTLKVVDILSVAYGKLWDLLARL
jgi:hypothetical protein